MTLWLEPCEVERKESSKFSVYLPLSTPPPFPNSINDHEMCAELLLERVNAHELNSQDNGGRTVVHASAYNDSMECLALLLRRGPAVSVVDSQGMTALMMAAKHGHAGIIGEWGGGGGFMGGVGVAMRGNGYETLVEAWLHGRGGIHWLPLPWVCSAGRCIRAMGRCGSCKPDLHNPKAPSSDTLLTQ